MQARQSAVVMALTCAAGVLLAAQEPQAPPAATQPLVPVFRSGVEAVQVSVIVTDESGLPVPGLTADDFEVFEGKVARPISTFAAVDIPLERTERVGAGESDVIGNDRPPGRVYLIVLDQMSPDLALRTRHVLRQFIERYFGPNDTAAVVATTRVLRDAGHEFTSSSQRLLAAIDKFDGGDALSGWGREKNFTMDLRDLMRAAAAIRGGRKAVIFVSTSIPVDPYRLIGFRPSPLGRMFSDVNLEFEDAISYATRNNIAFYPIDPIGLTTEFGGVEELERRGDLAGLAELTGGFALTSSNNFQDAFERLVRENSTYYVLGFDSAEERRDGRYVSLEVRVKRPGLQVRTLGGYLTPSGRIRQPRTPGSVLAAVWDAVSSPMTTNGVPMRMFAAPFQKNGKDATVAISLEIDATGLNLVEADGAYRGELEILFATTDAKRKRYPIYRHRATVALKPDTYERVSRTSLRVISQLTLPEGRYQLRASAGGAVLAGSVVYDLDVPDFRDDFAMSGIALTSLQASETFTVSPHERLDAPLPWAPTTAREFSREDTVTLFAELYENRRKPHTVSFTVDLRDQSGRSLGTYSAERMSEPRPQGPSTYAFGPNVHLAEVPPGRYLLHVEARSSLDRNKPLVRDIPITVR